jgi:hypothetical protein
MSNTIMALVAIGPNEAVCYRYYRIPVQSRLMYACHNTMGDRTLFYRARRRNLIRSILGMLPEGVPKVERYADPSWYDPTDDSLDETAWLDADVGWAAVSVENGGWGLLDLTHVGDAIAASAILSTRTWRAMSKGPWPTWPPYRRVSRVRDICRHHRVPVHDTYTSRNIYACLHTQHNTSLPDIM